MQASSDARKVLVRLKCGCCLPDGSTERDQLIVSRAASVFHWSSCNAVHARLAVNAASIVEVDWTLDSVE